MNNPKVFEFAKEIGMETLALMDKIKEWKLPVRSHMSELDSDLIDKINEKLNEEKGTSAGKKVTTKAKAKTKAKKKVAVKKTATAVKPATGVVRKKTASKVIRRKKEEVEELAAQEAAEAAAAAEAELAGAQASSAAPATAETPSADTSPSVAVQAPEESAEPLKAKETDSSGDGESEEQKMAPRKKEVVVGQSGHASEARPVQLGRKNIVGRMDLSRVQGPGGRPGPGRPGPAGGAGPRPVGAGPGRNLRPGFVSQAAPMPDMMPPSEEEARRSRVGPDKKRRGPGDQSAPTPREQEESEAFIPTEFRKREMVFQPKKKRSATRENARTQLTTPAAHKRVLKVDQTMRLSEVAQSMGIKAPQLIRALMNNGAMVNMNSELDFDTIALIVPEFGWEAQNVHRSAEELILETAFGDLEAEPVTRPPVVTVMGHVDHGKTSLLDSIRKANVVKGEAGGITQHIGAYQVSLDDGYLITFIDTPGHEAFTAMRARGANVTDVAIIVVAADDGAMPQTVEAINHAKAAGVPIIVAINKMDKPDANPDRIKQQMTEYELVPEEWGGETIFCPVSAIEKTGLKELLEQIQLVAEMQDLKANPKKSGTGIVVEARLEKGRGPTATMLVQDGTVAVGQSIVAGTVKGRIRSLVNDRGERLKEAGPGMPVEILGLEATPSAGDRCDIVKDDKTAEEVIAIRKSIEAKKAAAASVPKMSLDAIFSKVTQGDVKELAIVLKGDVAGSVEAVEGMLAKLSTAEVKTKVIHSAVGGVTESDVLLASTAGGLIIGFNVRPDSGALAAAKKEGIEIRTYSIVYELVDDMKKAMSGLLSPDIVEKVMGHAEVRNTFSVPRIGTIAGCFVTDGKVNRNNFVRLLRNGKIVYEGNIGSLKRFKDDAKEVASGYECGIGIENFNDVKVGDVIETYIKEEVARELQPSAEA